MNKTESHEEMMARLFPVRSEFDRQMQELRKEVTKFKTSVDECCEAIKSFKANL